MLAQDTMMAKIFCFAFLASLAILGVESVDKDKALELHNHIRQLVREGKVPSQPAGKNLVDLKWDDGLASLAAVNANKCVFAHDSPQDPRFYVGQNIAYTAHGKPNEDWKEAVDMWYNEYKDYTYSNHFNSKAGHYTQLVWAKSQYIGCAYANCPNLENYYVCNYGPGGNMEGEYPYEQA